MKILLIDAYDSFVYIIANYLQVLQCDVDVIRHDKLQLEKLDKKYDGIVLGPGPGHPRESGYLALLQGYADQLPIFGVCLGMQAIGEFYGVPVVKAEHRRHGKVSEITHDGKGCFTGLPSPMKVTRYHSLVVNDAVLPNRDLMITARADDDGYVMGIRHGVYPVEGVQFHPESVATEEGMMIFSNFIQAVAAHAQAQHGAIDKV
ncbi:aminodeoxychorismate/anthranilate synthase component II [Neisseriaceae bacterium ESL0693]|nr:aminodeoxychorismate/anthranilate synthase component II [Neisseriaceae bacterium ESL0693]